MLDRLQDLVAIQARIRPERTALVYQDERISYGALDALSSQIARTLKEAGCRRGDRVPVLMPKCPMAVAALLGVYKADGIYVPLDAASPAPRLNRILESCGATLLLAGGIDGRRLDALLDGSAPAGGVLTGWLGQNPSPCSIRAAFTMHDVRRASAAPVVGENTPADPAHILYTSGSTGMPKGVVITHGNVLTFVEWAAAYFELDADDRVSAHPPLHFDLSFFDLFGAFAVGAEVHLVPPGLNVLPNRLSDFIRTSALTQWFSVPSVLVYLAQFDLVRPDDFPHLKRLLWCGEVLPTPTLIYWMRRLPHVHFTNLYGPTETTIASTYYTVPRCPADPQEPIPIGKACGAEDVHVLDPLLRPVAAGEIGELYIGGDGVSPGYWGDPDRTGAAFLQDPAHQNRRLYRTGDLARVGEDGLVYFLGRTDSQIKCRGHRIELGEIEAALHTVAGVHESAVLAVQAGGFEGTTICCAYVPRAGAGLTSTLLRQELSKRVPGYMLPARWLAFDSFPKNANGKIDRARLRGLFEGHAASLS